MSELTSRTAWRLGIGRHRAAIYLALLFQAIAWSGPIVRSIAFGGGASELKAMIDSVGQFLSHPAAVVIATVALTIFARVRASPILRPDYQRWLRLTPWRPGDRLPLGEGGGLGSLIWLPAASVALAAVMGAPAAWLMAVAFVSATSLVVAIEADTMRPSVIAFALMAAVVVTIAQAAVGERSLSSLGLASQLAIVVAARRSLLERARRGDAIDWRQRAADPGRHLGWMRQLTLSPHAGRKVGWVLAFAAGSGVSLAWVLQQFTRLSRTTLEPGGPLVVCVVLAAAGRLAMLQGAAMLQARKLLRWPPRRTASRRVVAFVFATIAFVVAVLLMMDHVPAAYVPAATGAFASVAVAMTSLLPPTAREWQAAGPTAIPIKMAAAEKQSEAQLRRMMNRGRSNGGG